MRKITVLLILLMLAGMNSYAQKKSGTLYSEHEYIDVTREVWKAIVAGDEAKIQSFYADTVQIFRNGVGRGKVTKEKMAQSNVQWVSDYENLKVMDDKPAFPDALEYKDWGIVVQDWIRLVGIHTETGIILDLPIHNMYAFNDDGKIYMDVSYFDDDIFEEIYNSKTKKKNGTVYINHPYIVSVRKAMNAFVANDKETWASYYSPEARFSSSALPVGKNLSLEENWGSLTMLFQGDDRKLKVEQTGYPDCIYYEKYQGWVVYSWWKMTVTKGDKRYEIPVMLSHDFNDEGKIVWERQYVSSNHFDELWPE